MTYYLNHACLQFVFSLLGYVGYEQGGQLTEAVRRNPHSVILFDEVEKAHEDVLNMMLQIMDEGKLTDGKGRVVNFKNAVIVMTSNIGSQKIVEATKGTSTADLTEKSIDTARLVKEELEQSWKPELLNRIDEIIIFSPLSFDTLREIAGNIIDDAAKRASAAQEITINVADNLVAAVTREGSLFADQYGARPIRRAVQRYLEDTLSEAVMKDFIKEGDEITVEVTEIREIKGVKIADDQPVVRISKLGSYDSILVPVDLDTGIGGAVGQDLEWQALYGDLPSFNDDSSSPPRESDPTWE